MNGTGSGTITIMDEWEVQGEAFRLVDKSAGPIELQVAVANEDYTDWQPEREHFVHGVLCARVIELSRSHAKLAESIHYPNCWDTMAYPSLQEALDEIGCNADHESLYPDRFCVGCKEKDYMKFPHTNVNLCGKCFSGLNLKDIVK